MAEYSFDIAAKVDMQELSNAIDMTRKEVENRFDFKGAKIEIKLEKEALELACPDEMKMNQLIDVVQTKMIKRDLNLKSMKFGEFETNVSGLVKCKAEIQNGLNQDQMKKITKLIKDSKLKVQTRIQGDVIRVTGKSKDDLQQVIGAVKQADFDFLTTFENYR